MAYELEASLLLTALALVPTTEIPSRDLLVYRDNTEDDALRLIERFAYLTATTSPYCPFGHNFRIQRDIAVPLYTLKQDTQQEWAIEVICDGRPLVFSFSNKPDVLELQRFLTGYEVKTSFLGAEAWFKLKRSVTKRRRKSEHHGVAEIQLWEWPDESQGVTQLSRTTTRSSRNRTPASSVAPSEFSRSDAVTVQTDYSTGRQAVIAALNHPPLLVLFLQESKHYTMLSIDSELLVRSQTRTASADNDSIKHRHSRMSPDRRLVRGPLPPRGRFNDGRQLAKERSHGCPNKLRGPGRRWSKTLEPMLDGSVKQV